MNLVKKVIERFYIVLGFNVLKIDYGSGVVERVRYVCIDKLRFV